MLKEIFGVDFLTLNSSLVYSTYGTIFSLIYLILLAMFYRYKNYNKLLYNKINRIFC